MFNKQFTRGAVKKETTGDQNHDVIKHRGEIRRKHRTTPKRFTSKYKSLMNSFKDDNKKEENPREAQEDLEFDFKNTSNL